MAFDDALGMVLLAVPGTSVVEWAARASADSRLLAGSQRLQQLRIARAILRVHGDRIADASFLSDMHQGNDAVRRDLVYARYLAATPIAIAVGRTVLLPRRRDARVAIARAELDNAIATALAGCSAGTIRRSATSVRVEFGRAGVTRSNRDGSIELEEKRPAAIALYHLFLDDLAERREASDAWLARESTAAAIFALSPETVRESIEELVALGRLTRSYYSGEPRVLAA